MELDVVAHRTYVPMGSGQVASGRVERGRLPSRHRRPQLEPRPAPVSQTGRRSQAARRRQQRSEEVYLAWDERLFALVVAKLLRPDQVEDERARRELEREAEIVGRLAHPVILRGFDAVLDGLTPTSCWSTSRGRRSGRLIRRQSPARAVAAAGDPRRRGAPLPRSRGDRAPGREARQHRQGRAAAPDRPEHRASAGARRLADDGDRNRCLHGAEHAIRGRSRIRSAPRRMSGASARPCTTRSPASARSRAPRTPASLGMTVRFPSSSSPRRCPRACRARCGSSLRACSRAIPRSVRRRPRSPRRSSRSFRSCRRGSAGAARARSRRGSACPGLLRGRAQGTNGGEPAWGPTASHSATAGASIGRANR